MEYFSRSSRRLTCLCAVLFALSSCGGGGHSNSVPATGSSAAPAATPTAVGVVPGSQPTVAPSPGSSPTVNAAAFSCPSSTAATSVAAGPRSGVEASRRMTARRPRVSAAVPAASGTQLVAVTYNAQTASAQRTALGTRYASLGATLVREYQFNHTNLTTHVLKVPAAQVASTEASLRAQAGVRSVGLTGNRRFAASVNAPLYTNDPYFNGFANPVPPTTGAAVPAPTFQVQPLVESATVPGQWDMHVIRLGYAFAYSQAANGSGTSDSLALGSPLVKVAIIDTGEDSTHPELSSKIVYQRCFITNAAGTQSTSSFSTDEDGHGTNVAGIAAAATNNSLGFVGAGGNVGIYAYRVFPTPDDNCASPTSTDSQCGTDTQDIASAINDAVANHVNVISLSLGGSPCVNGADSDPTEGAAVADAIAANIIVVAAAGNGGGPPVEAPGCDPGVIAVGATSLDDGAPNGSGVTRGSATAPVEYVASYTDAGTPGAAVGSASAWGIVAPGGDPSSDSDIDDLHWIDHIWTSTPFKASTSDTSFTGDCNGDYPAETGAADCRTFIAGTSQATPHVAGAAALILSVNTAYQSPAAMKQLLCSTAADISDPNEGCGRLDVYRAMATALHDPNLPATSPIP